MIKTAFLAASFLSLMAVQAVASSWDVDQDASSIDVRYTQGGSENSAQFKGFAAEIVFDPANLSQASIQAEIDIASFGSGNTQIDGAVAGSQWFAVSLFPQAIFESTEVREADGGIYEIDGNLTIREATVPVTLTGPITIDGDRAVAVVEVTLDRSQFGVGQGDFESGDQIGHAVPVVITIEADRR